MTPAAVSVVIPAYNYSRFVPQAIESALRQTLPALEVLVIDDGSTDDTAKVVADRFGAEPRVRYIHQANAGLSSARNTGIRHARGEFVGFLDADDLWKPEFLAEVMARFTRLPPEFAIIAARSELVTLDGALLPRKPFNRLDDREFTVADILFKSRFAPSATVVRKSVFAELGDFDTTLRSSEDRDMWVRIATRHRVLRCAAQLVIVRRHSTSMSTHADRMKLNTGRTLEKARHNPELARLPATFWRQALAFFRYETAWMYFEEGRRGAALRDLLASVGYWPWFADPRSFQEPSLFRLRALKHFLSAPNPGRQAARAAQQP